MHVPGLQSCSLSSLARVGCSSQFVGATSVQNFHFLSLQIIIILTVIHFVVFSVRPKQSGVHLCFSALHLCNSVQFCPPRFQKFKLRIGPESLKCDYSCCICSGNFVSSNFIPSVAGLDLNPGQWLSGLIGAMLLVCGSVARRWWCRCL